MRLPSALPQACVHLALFRKHASPNASALQTHFFDKGDLRHALTTGQREDLLQVTHVHVIHVHVVHVHVIHVHVSHVQVVHVHVIYVQLVHVHVIHAHLCNCKHCPPRCSTLSMTLFLISISISRLNLSPIR